MLTSLLVLALTAQAEPSAATPNPALARADLLAKLALKNGAEARAAAPLIRLHELADQLEDLNLLAEPYSNLIWRRNTEPNVRVLAKLFMADVERARGRTVRAAELVASLGFVQDWHVVGSFDNEGKGGCDTDFGPESATDLSATYPAAGREVGWRKPNAKSVDGFVDLSQTLKPNTDAVAYGLTFLKADAETKATLSLGTPGAFRLFVNGVKVASSDRYNLPRVDQHRVQVNLRKGTNRVLLKVCQVGGPLGFSFRAERPENAGVKGSFSVVLPDAVPPLEKGGAPQPAPQPTLAEVLEKKLKATPNDHELRADYATVLAWTRAYPDTEHAPDMEAERAALNRPDDAELQLIAGSLHLDDGNDRRRFLEAALRIDPKHPFARLALAHHELGREHPEVALRLAEGLIADFPAFAAAYVTKARALDALGEKVRAVRTTEEAFAKFPHVPLVGREAVSASRRLDRTDEAIARARMVVSLRFDDLNTRRSLATMLADLGRIDDAAEQYKKLLALDPFDASSLLHLAELLSANGRLDEGRAAFEQARALAPDDPEVFEREGKALLHSGKKDEALAAFQRSLVLRPQNPALKEMLRTLRGEDAGGPAPEAMALAPLLEGAKALKGEDAVTLAEVTHVRVQQSGLSSRFNQLVVKALTQRGVDAFRQVPIQWSPDRQEVRVLRARITKPDGSVVDSFSEQDRNINEPWTGMYYDARARVLTFPALAPGDVLEVQFRLDDTAVDNLLSDYWGDVDAVQSIYPRQHYRYVVDMPAARPLYWNAASLPKWVKTSVAKGGERTVYRFEADDVARVIPEPQMPGWAEVATPLHLSTYENWEKVGRYYWGLVKDQLVPNEELRRTVDGLLKGVDKNDTAKVVGVIYDFVVTNTRYVALEFGIHGYKPYRVDRILARKFGDCKDKASLIYAMLKVAGVDARLVLLRMRNLGTLSPEVASLSAFNHAIAYVPKLDLFLDGTAEFHGSRELPSADRVANVLVVEPDAPARFLVTPEAQPEDNVTTLTLDVTLKADGSAQAKGSMVAAGQGAPELRRTYETPATRQATFEQQWAQSFPGVQASEVTLSDPKALEQPATLGFTMAMPRYAEAGAGLLRFFPFGSGRTFTQALAPLAERSFDAQFPGVWTSRLVFTYTLPAGWTVPDVPADVVEESPFGSLRISVKKDAGKLRVEGTLVMGRARVTAKEYPAFRAWLMQVDQQFARKVVAQRGDQTASR